MREVEKGIFTAVFVAAGSIHVQHTHQICEIEAIEKNRRD